ncbi:Endogenous alpha-amylase/subtilisin inhibitor [Triticum urartu]|uniref:Endogenous alpha-amylase/subtilisin inhibitor n=1 Tax=Triticum urartu TaxID=4572 RepID=M7ZF09_TRIUA|nr:Endogenous alpha-amylase/subtilisin inhibitor [Triticum urartu]
MMKANLPPNLSQTKHAMQWRKPTFRGAEVHEYKLMACGDSCQDLGVFRDLKGGAWFLGATEPYHVIVFKKAPPA